MINITISDEIKKVCPELKIVAIEYFGNNSEFCPGLWEEINQFENSFRKQYKIEDVNKITTIQATRNAYKKLGKDPNRYRPSAEALCRRIIRGLPIYRINTFVDMINLISMKSGYSIGGFDADKINGNLTLGVGKPEEHFEAIGRGILNIDGLPVYRDETGGIGTPTSDEERTKLNINTNHLLMIINAYSGEEGIPKTIDYVKFLLSNYILEGKSLNVEIKIY